MTNLSAEKQITVVTAEKGDFTDMGILPGTTAQDVLNAVGLPGGYVLSLGRGQDAFGSNEEIYDIVRNGQKVYACTPVEVGSSDDDDDGDENEETEEETPFSLFKPSFSTRLREALNIPPNPLSGWLSCESSLNLIFSQRERDKEKLDKIIGKARHRERDREELDKVINKTVKRSEIPHWQRQGWKKSANQYTGYFRTPYGSFQGKAHVHPSKSIDLFIKDPPKCLRAHPHWKCFFPRPNGWYWIHNYDEGMFDISSGIISVESLLIEAFNNK